MTPFWQAGYEAASAYSGGKATPNPYRHPSCEHDEWEAGYGVGCAALESEAEGAADKIDALAPPDLSR